MGIRDQLEDLEEIVRRLSSEYTRLAQWISLLKNEVKTLNDDLEFVRKLVQEDSDLAKKSLGKFAFLKEMLIKGKGREMKIYKFKCLKCGEINYTCSKEDNSGCWNCGFTQFELVGEEPL